MLFEKLADGIMKHAKLIICVWIVLLIVSVPFIYKVFAEPEDILEYDMTNMVSSDSESVQGMMTILDPTYFYQSSLNGDLLLVVECNDDEQKTVAETTFCDRLKDNLYDEYGMKNVSMITMGFNSKTGTTPGILLVALGFEDDRNQYDEVGTIRSIVGESKVGLNVGTTYLTGSIAISQDTMDSSMEDVMKIDPFSIFLVLILIGLFFRSLVSSATPPVTIGFAYGIVMMVIFGLAQFLQIYYVTSTIVLVSMLGAGCDYCIFIIARYREERKEGKDKEGALREAIIWAGESITTSGISVIIGFGVISFCTFSMVATMGMVMASGIVFALLAALTLIPSILMMVGDKIFYPSTMDSYADDSKVMSGWYGKMSELGKRYFRNSAKLSLKYAGIIVVIVVLITAPLAYVTLTEKTSYDMITIMPDCESKEGVNAIVANSNGGMIMPTYILMDAGKEIATIDDEGGHIGSLTLGTLTWNDPSYGPQYFVQTTMLAEPVADTLPYYITQNSPDNIASTLGVLDSKTILSFPQGKETLLALLPAEMSSQVGMIIDSTAIPDDEKYPMLDYMLNYQFGTISKYVDGHQYVKVTVIVDDQPMSEKSMGTLNEIEIANEQYILSTTGSAFFSTSIVTGSVRAVDDISKIVNSEFKYIEVAVVVLIFLLLFFVMKSYFTPMRSIITIVMSVVWTLGMTHLLFGHLLGMPITWIVPIILFVICLGLGMDYDILLTTRIKENVIKGMTNDEAILHAVEKSGAVITICGLIMGGAFLTMVLSTSPMLMEFGFALGFAILVDALFIRTYVVPAVMHLMGKWNWVGPSFFSIKRE